MEKRVSKLSLSLMAERKVVAEMNDKYHFGSMPGCQNALCEHDGKTACCASPRSQAGQATVEYLVVGLALIALITALGVFANRVEEGLFVEHTADSASHSLTTNSAGSIGDVLLY